MAFQKKDFSQIYNALVQDTQNRLPEVTDFSEGSIIRSLYESFTYELTLLYEQLDLVYQGSFIDTATGLDLDRVVSVLNIKRNAPDFAIGETTFFCEEGFDRDVLIPLGTLISTEELPGQPDSKKVYRTRKEAYIPAGETSVTVGVIALQAGPEWATPAETLVVMLRPVPGIKNVINSDKTLFLGHDRETDEELRERAKRALLASGQSTQVAIEDALLAMPGIHNVSVKEDAPGSISVYVDGLNDYNFAAVRKKLDAVRAAGIYARLQPARIRGLEFNLTFQCQAGFSDEERSELESKAANTLEESITAVGMGEPLIYAQIIRNLLEIEGVKDLIKLTLQQFRESDRACGSLLLKRKDALPLEIPLGKTLQTKNGQPFKILQSFQLKPADREITAPVEALRAGSSNELKTSGSNVQWQDLVLGDSTFSISNAQPLLLPREEKDLAQVRQFKGDDDERFHLSSIKVKAVEA